MLHKCAYLNVLILSCKLLRHPYNEVLGKKSGYNISFNRQMYTFESTLIFFFFFVFAKSALFETRPRYAHQ
jgi:hypothetical protein